MEKGNLTGRQLRKSLKLQNIGGDGVKPKKVRIYTPNLNVVRRKQKTDSPQKSIPADTGRTVERNKIKRNVQTPDVFFEGSSNLHSYKRLRNHKAADTQIPAKRPKKRTILSSSDEEDAPECLTESKEESQKIEVEDEKVFSLEPVELQNNMKQNLGNGQSTKYPRYLLDSGEHNIKQEEKESVLPLSFTTSKLYNKNHPALMVFKLPDFISAKSSGNAKAPKQVGVSLKEVDAGKLGKLTIRRSGKMQIQIGRIKYDVDDVNVLTEMTQVASFSNTNNEPNLFNLGYVQKWYNIVPAWDDLVVK